MNINLITNNNKLSKRAKRLEKENELLRKQNSDFINENSELKQKNQRLDSLIKEIEELKSEYEKSIKAAKTAQQNYKNIYRECLILKKRFKNDSDYFRQQFQN